MDDNGYHDDNKSVYKEDNKRCRELNAVEAKTATTKIMTTNTLSTKAMITKKMASMVMARFVAMCWPRM